LCAIVLSVIDLICIVCVFTWEIKAWNAKNIL
jgi:hypothetical protein